MSIVNATSPINLGCCRRLLLTETGLERAIRPCYVAFTADFDAISSGVIEVNQHTALLFFLSVTVAFPQDSQSNQAQDIPLTVPAGVPLRLYLTKQIMKRRDAPGGSRARRARVCFRSRGDSFGHSSDWACGAGDPFKWQRARAILGGDFTPLRVAQVDFTSLRLADGREIQLHTFSSAGLNSLLPLRPPKKRNQNAQSSSGLVATTKQNLKDQADAQIDRIKSLPDLVRGTDKKEWLSDYLMSRLPYHPQYVRSRTRSTRNLQHPSVSEQRLLLPAP